MDATLEDGSPRWTARLTAWPWILFLLRVLVVFAALAAPYFLLELSWAWWASIGAVGLFVAWRVVVDCLKARGTPKQPWRISLLLALYSSGAPILLVIGLVLVFGFTWTLWAYDPAMLPPGRRPDGLSALAWISGICFGLPLAFLMFAPYLARKEGGPASRLLSGIRAQGAGRFRKDWLSSTAGCMGIFAVLILGGNLFLLRRLELWRDQDGVVTAWEMVIAWPILPWELVLCAVMLSVARSLEVGAEETNAIVRAYTDGEAGQPGLNARAKILVGALFACGFAAFAFFMFYPDYLDLATKEGRKSVRGVGYVVEALAKQQKADDRSLAVLIEELNRAGSWTPGAPNVGLGALVEDPAKVFSDSCTVRVAAGAVDPADTNAFVEGGAGESEQNLKWCIAVSCVSPVTWNTSPVLMRFSTHASQAQNWRDHGYVDLSGNGRATTPGGYCTANGGLAETYQG